jgi:hypothetical protein
MLRAPTILLMRLSDSSCKLRVRRSRHEASVLLRTPEGGFFDCVRVKEHTEKRYTQQDWVENYKALYAGAYGTYGSCFDNVEDEEKNMKKVEEENSDETRYAFQKNRVLNPGLAFITIMKQCKLAEEVPGDFTVLHSKWDPTQAVLELLVSNDVAQSEFCIASTDYTSMLLFFEPVVFEDEEAPAGLKRARSDDAPASE